MAKIYGLKAAAQVLNIKHSRLRSLIKTLQVAKADLPKKGGIPKGGNSYLWEDADKLEDWYWTQRLTIANQIHGQRTVKGKGEGAKILAITGKDLKDHVGDLRLEFPNLEPELSDCFIRSGGTTGRGYRWADPESLIQWWRTTCRMLDELYDARANPPKKAPLALAPPTPENTDMEDGKMEIQLQFTSDPMLKDSDPLLDPALEEEIRDIYNTITNFSLFLGVKPAPFNEFVDQLFTLGLKEWRKQAKATDITDVLPQKKPNPRPRKKKTQHPDRI